MFSNSEIKLIWEGFRLRGFFAIFGQRKRPRRIHQLRSTKISALYLCWNSSIETTPLKQPYISRIGKKNDRYKTEYGLDLRSSPSGLELQTTTLSFKELNRIGKNDIEPLESQDLKVEDPQQPIKHLSKIGSFIFNSFCLLHFGELKPMIIPSMIYVLPMFVKTKI